MATDSTPIKIPARTRHLIRLGATMNNCTMGAFVDEAVTQFLANHSGEIEAGLDNARDVLTVRAAGEGDT